VDIHFVGRRFTASASASVAVIVTEPVDAAALAAWDAATDGALSRALSGSSFKGSLGQCLDLIAPHGLTAARVTLIGAGRELTALSVEAAAAAAYSAVKNSGLAELAIVLPGDDARLAAAAAQGVRLAAYRFAGYKITPRPEASPSVQKVTLVCSDPEGARAIRITNWRSLWAFGAKVGFACALVLACADALDRVWVANAWPAPRELLQDVLPGVVWLVGGAIAICVALILLFSAAVVWPLTLVFALVGWLLFGKIGALIGLGLAGSLALLVGANLTLRGFET
jgi:Cytosol aminopeptidase family, N-terminal domain